MLNKHTLSPALYAGYPRFYPAGGHEREHAPAAAGRGVADVVLVAVVPVEQAPTIKISKNCNKMIST